MCSAETCTLDVIPTRGSIQVKMKVIKHSIQFITELDETDPTSQRLLALSPLDQTRLLDGMLKNLLVPSLQPIIDELNSGNSYATLKLAN